ncbi:hypothetical protein [Actinomadura rugatobispora]|uniref:Uncharacterized protein n=1 Tax=Actinomadura rugatobispora TaxID=1994 RepID=A0ABW1A1L7_9ACTN|nr:hypothetical protein GCM10010200_049070 [Actinomadura rugatobispora]
MSSFSGWAVVDLKDGRDPGEFVRALAAAHDAALDVVVEGARVFVFADFGVTLSSAVEKLLPEWGARAIAASDFDEHGVTNEVLGPDGAAVHTASIDEEGGGLPEDDTPESRRAAAALFGVEPSALDRVSATWSEGGAQPCVLGVPYLTWWTALGVPWPQPFESITVEPEKASGS